ncbi:MAG: hypothetical protein H0V22_00190 [Solirubrobacterales bacterium]|nr:hypothetical protein [Solirubrobacterales bacterium]
MKRRHTREELRELFGVVAGEEFVVDRPVPPTSPAETTPEHFVVWSAARAESNLAYDDWCTTPGAERYLVYRAAEDRADAAEVALASAAA